MRDLLQAKELRQIQLIEYFIINDNFVPIEVLQDKFHINPRTLVNDLEEIAERLPIFHVDQAKKHIRLHVENCCGTYEAFAEYLRQDLSFGILDLLFREETMMMNTMADRLYTSETSIYRSIKKINKVLKEAGFDFAIQLTPCKLVGKEEDIRRFFSNFYYEAASPFTWPFETLPLNTLLKSLQVIIHAHIFPADFPMIYQSAIVIAINIIRIQKGHPLQKMSVGAAHSLPTLTPELAQAYLDLAEMAEIDPDCPQGLGNLLYPFLNYQVIYNYEWFVDRAFVDPFFNQSFLCLNNIIDTLKNRFGLSFKGNHRLIVLLHNTAVLGENLPGAFPILSQPNIEMVDVVKKWSPDIYAFVHGLMADYLGSVFDITAPLAIDNLLYTLISFWSNYPQVLVQESRKVKILLISRYSYKHLDHLKAVFQENLPKQIQVDTYRHYTIDVAELDKAGYDIVVADIPIKGFTRPYFLQIPIVPQEYHFIEIAKRISATRHRIADGDFRPKASPFPSRSF